MAVGDRTSKAMVQIEPMESECIEIAFEKTIEYPDTWKVLVIRHGMNEPAGGRILHEEICSV